MKDFPSLDEFYVRWLVELQREIDRKPRMPANAFANFADEMGWPKDEETLRRLAHATERVAQYYGVSLHGLPQNEVDALAKNFKIEAHAAKLADLLNSLSVVLSCDRFEPRMIDRKKADKANALLEKLTETDVLTPGELEAIKVLQWRIQQTTTERKQAKRTVFYWYAKPKLTRFWREECGKQGTIHRDSAGNLSDVAKFSFEAIGLVEQRLLGERLIDETTLLSLKGKMPEMPMALRQLMIRQMVGKALGATKNTTKSE